MSLLGLQRNGAGPVLVWLHGFTQTKDSGRTFRSILAGTYEVLTIDLPGHGENSSIAASLDETADLLASSLPSEPFILGGYSMGGRVALHFALRHQERLSALVVLSATLGLRDDVERAARRARDNALADRIELIGADAFLDEWLAQPMFATLPDDPLERVARSSNARGLANSLRTTGTGTQAWLGETITAVTVPTLVIAGTNDTKFVNEARLLDDALPTSTTSLVKDVGHAAHLERPGEVAALLASVQPQ
ncbi:MAG TPA: alpha/beta fold hydrolase [Acidimicrobiales bacterium]|jgi:2-succinyl-6-hydroxy-2,4-cyclohexadiene-1-carboxylate synthase|nr:alpha/beta fold hydrolase [Acidimicrobiales bacterium]